MLLCEHSDLLFQVPFGMLSHMVQIGLHKGLHLLQSLQLLWKPFKTIDYSINNSKTKNSMGACHIQNPNGLSCLSDGVHKMKQLALPFSGNFGVCFGTSLSCQVLKVSRAYLPSSVTHVSRQGHLLFPVHKIKTLKGMKD